jgi:hypothetical protein
MLWIQNAVAISLENWTNQRLEFPALSIADGAVDRRVVYWSHVVE